MRNDKCQMCMKILAGRRAANETDPPITSSEARGLVEETGPPIA